MIHVGDGLRYQLKQLIPKDYERIMIITDSNIRSLYLQDLQQALGNDGDILVHTIQPGEQAKSFKEFEECHTAAIHHGLNRHSLIIALGGGVVGDLAGFVAATYMRGIDYVQVPTTILAHDSSVGGKVAINHPLSKNVIGHFHQPKAVIYDTETLNTLPEQEWRSGMAEVIKHAWINDSDMLHTCLNLESFSSVSKNLIEELLSEGIAIKSDIVIKDEREQGVRSFLNFGHTLGHALEGEFGYGELTHGEAVALGIDFALFLSERYVQKDPLPRKVYQEWLNRHGYPIQYLADLDTDAVLERIKRDKKNQSKSIRFVLLEGIGQPLMHPFEGATLKKELELYKEYWMK